MQRKSNSGVVAGIIAWLFAIYLAMSLITGHDQTTVLCIYAGCSALSFVAYGIDKNAALHGTRRISESTLHWLDLLCGWPGGYAAQRIFRHKTTKEPFGSIFLATAVLNILGFVLYSSSAALSQG